MKWKNIGLKVDEKWKKSINILLKHYGGDDD